MKYKNEQDLEWLLDYEVAQSVRYRRFISLVMLSVDGDLNKLSQVLEGMIRSSDPLFFLDDAIVVLMGDTDTDGSLKVIRRYQEMIGGAMDVRYSVASFPADGKIAKKLIHTAQHRLNMAKKSVSKKVVVEG